jgi:hypothetical protein
MQLMPSDALHTQTLPKAKADGRYRPVLHPSGMWVAAAYTRQSDIVTRTIHGANFGKFKAMVLYANRSMAERHCRRLNVRL